jgi:hypothetical protein
MAHAAHDPVGDRLRRMQEAHIDPAAEPRLVEAPIDAQVELEQRLRMLVAFGRIEQHAAAADRGQGQMRDIRGRRRHLAQHGRLQRPVHVVGGADLDGQHVAPDGVDVVLRDQHAHDRVFLADDIADDIALVQEAAGQVLPFADKESPRFAGLEVEVREMLAGKIELALGEADLLAQDVGLHDVLWQRRIEAQLQCRDASRSHRSAAPARSPRP